MNPRHRWLVLPFAALVPALFPVVECIAGAIAARGVGVIVSDVRRTDTCSLPAGVQYVGYWNHFSNTLSTPQGPFFHVLVLGCETPDSLGLGGIEFGVQYDGGYAPEGGAQPISVFGWTLCGDLEFPSTGWPAPGTGTLVTWTQAHCETTAPLSENFIVKVAGYFYMGAYATSALQITSRPVSGRMKVAHCSGFEHDLTDIPYSGGIAGFGQFGWPGCLIEPLPIRKTTWSGIKSLTR